MGRRVKYALLTFFAASAIGSTETLYAQTADKSAAPSSSSVPAPKKENVPTKKLSLQIVKD